MSNTIRTITTVSGTRVTEILYYTSTFDSVEGRRVRTITSTRTITGDNGGASPNSNTQIGGINNPSTTTTSGAVPASSDVNTVTSGGSSGAVTNRPAQVTSTPPSSGGGSGISTGSLAGAAIGCLIGGALIAFLVAFLIFRKREQRRTNAAGYYRPNDSPNRGEVVALTEKPSSKSAGAVTGWQAFLPQSADDRTIQNGVKTFFNLIELHVDNFYRKAPVELDQRTLDALARIDSGKLPGRIDQLMQDQRLVLPVIKHCIADLLITRMSPLEYHDTSLLPSNISTIPGKLQASSLSSNERSGTFYSPLWSLC